VPRSSNQKIRKSQQRLKKTTGWADSKTASTSKSVDPCRPGLPAEDSIVSEVRFTSPKGNVYRIIKTDETDSYDKVSKRRSKGRIR
jgi:hypothetical protein